VRALLIFYGRIKVKKVIVYTDGACPGNPGPMGIGFILRYNGHEIKVGRYIGEGTNNRAEILAVIEALKSIKRRDVHVVLHTDSQLVYGYLTQGWKVKKNKELVEEMKKLCREFAKFEVVKVKGHADNVANNEVDRLAREAARKKKDSAERKP